MLKNKIYQQKISEKWADLEMLQEFKELTAELANNLEQVGDKLETMKTGTESVALILANWQNVVNSISLASLGLMKYTDADYETGTPLPEALVRIKLDKDEDVDEEAEEAVEE